MYCGSTRWDELVFLVRQHGPTVKHFPIDVLMPLYAMVCFKNQSPVKEYLDPCSVRPHSTVLFRPPLNEHTMWRGAETRLEHTDSSNLAKPTSPPFTYSKLRGPVEHRLARTECRLLCSRGRERPVTSTLWRRSYGSDPGHPVGLVARRSVQNSFRGRHMVICG